MRDFLDRAEGCGLVAPERLCKVLDIGGWDTLCGQKLQPMIRGIRRQDDLEALGELVAVAHASRVVSEPFVVKKLRNPERSAAPLPHFLGAGASHDDPPIARPESPIGGKRRGMSAK